MSIETQVVWSIPMAQETIDLINARAQEFIDQGKEIGNAVINSTSTQTTVNRFWIDADTAQEWIDFVVPYNPISAVILN
jgi:hypothetical protein